MDAREVDRITTQLTSVYGQTIKVGQDGQRRLVQIERVELYPGCQPPQTTMLLVLDPGHPKPQVFVTPGQHLANGRLPKNNSNILIAGQTWMQFSFNIPWSDGDNIMRFIAASRQRFAQMSRSVELRIPFGLGETLQEHIYRPGHHEHVVFGLVSHSTRRGSTHLFLRQLIPLRESDYVPNAAHGAMWRGSAMFPLMEAAMERGLGIVIFHAHDHAGLPGLSRDDLQSADKLIPMFQKRVPTRPHGTVVVSRTHASGLVWLPGVRRPQSLTKIRWFGSAIVDFDCRQQSISLETPDEYARQALLVGPEGQAKLHGARVAVVGAGGGGSHVIQQLAYAGVGEIVVIDPDTYQNSNRHRVVSASRADLGCPKVDIFHRLVRKIGLGGRVRRVRAAVPDVVAVEALRDCDVIVGCVDTLFARSDLQELASRYLVPYVDIGATIRPVPEAPASDPRIVVAGNVFTFIPGSFCLWCCGFLTGEKIEAEQKGPTRGYFEKNRQEAQVITFNGVLASQAVTEVLQILTGFRGVGLRETDLRLPGTSTFRGYKKFDGVSGSLNEWGGIRRTDCPHCKNVLGAGDVIFTPVPLERTSAA